MRFSLGSSDILSRVALQLARGKEKTDATLDRLLTSGIMDPVKDDYRGSKADPGEKGEVEYGVVNPQ